jgi:integrase
MKYKVALMARIYHDGRYPYVRVQLKRGLPQAVPDATGYYLRFTPGKGEKRVIKSVGSDVQAAHAAFLEQEMRFEHVSRGLPLPAVIADRKTIAGSLQELLQDASARNLGKATLYSYRVYNGDFIKACDKLHFEDVTRQDIISYLDWIEKNVSRQRFGDRNATLGNRLRALTTLFRFAGFRLPLPTKAWPKLSRKNPKPVTQDVIAKRLLPACQTEDELDLIHFCLWTGFRKSEIKHVEYSDIDFERGLLNVKDKPQWGWKPKDREERPLHIPLNNRFLQRMQARQKRHEHSRDDLIFPCERTGRPDSNVERPIKMVAERAGITERIHLHRFRASFCTLMAEKFGPLKAQKLMGHSSLKTTMLYLNSGELTGEVGKKGVEELDLALVAAKR